MLLVGLIIDFKVGVELGGMITREKFWPLFMVTIFCPIFCNPPPTFGMDIQDARWRPSTPDVHRPPSAAEADLDTTGVQPAQRLPADV